MKSNVGITSVLRRYCVGALNRHLEPRWGSAPRALRAPRDIFGPIIVGVVR